LGHATYSVPTTHPERAPRINTVFDGEHWGALANGKAAGRSMDVSLALIAGALTLLTRSTWPDAIADELRASLAIAHNKPWRDAVEPLFAHLARLRREYGDADTAGDDAEADDFDTEPRDENARGENAHGDNARDTAHPMKAAHVYA
jgi:hypothetical protein